MFSIGKENIYRTSLDVDIENRTYIQQICLAHLYKIRLLRSSYFSLTKLNGAARYLAFAGNEKGAI